MPDGELLRLLATIATDVAIDPVTDSVRTFEGRPFPFVGPSAIEAHPAHASFLAGLEEHPVLGRLFPDDDETRGWIRGFRPRSVATRLINAALWDTVMDGDASRAAVESSLAAGLLGLEDLILGKPVGARVYVGFGAELPPDTAISTPWGTLRSRRPSDHTVLSASDAEYVPDAGSILETENQLLEEVLLDRGPGVLEIPTSLEHERWQRVALAIMLAERSDRVPPAHPWCHVQMQILSTGPLSAEFSQFRKGPRFETAEDVARLEKWLHLVDNAQLSPIAVERTVSMARRIVDHVDAFVDAVIVWESLFGAGDTQELSYRVSMTMACVLSADPRERVALQQDIKGLYTRRSQIVHGGKRLNSSQASELRQRAQRLTLDALRGVLEDHPHLLGQKATDHVAFVLGVLPETENDAVDADVRG